VATTYLFLTRSRAARIACSSTPWTHTLAFRLSESVKQALSILAAYLLTESLRTLLRAIVPNLTIVTPATRLLLLRVKETCSLPRAADLATIEQTWTLNHALRPCSAASTAAFCWVARAFACAKEGWLAFVEGCISTEGIKACATTTTFVRVVADIQVIPIVANEELGFVYRFKRDASFVCKARTHAEC